MPTRNPHSSRGARQMYSRQLRTRNPVSALGRPSASGSSGETLCAFGARSCLSDLPKKLAR